MSNVTCSSHAYCRMVFGDSMPLCCGDCKLTVCCNDSTLVAQLDSCNDKSTGPRNSLGSKTLAIVIGSIIGCFIVLLVANWLIKKYLCGKLSPSSRRGAVRDGQPHLTSFTNSAVAGGSLHSTLPVSEPAPPYTDIHLYNKVDHESSQAIYYKVPGDKSYYGIVASSQQVDLNIVNEELTSEPPPYATVIENRSTDEITT